MCSSGFETQNFKYKTNDDSRTNVKKRTEPAIAYSRCYSQCFLRRIINF
jgi:hypothetical protein